MKKLAFVIPWFSDKISGGAEIALRDLTIQLKNRGVDLEILTTCVEKFQSDWSKNFFYRGIDNINGIDVRRFKADARKASAFDAVNLKLMNGKNVSFEDESIFLNEMVTSDEMCTYIREHREEYGLFIFIPYMFGTTYFGMAAAGDRAAMIPCFHDEPYAHFDMFKTMFSRAAGMAFLSREEEKFAKSAYDLSNVKLCVAGLGVDEVQGDAARFREKFGIKEPFILYAGRKDHGKNVDTLVEYFARYKKSDKTGAKLVLVGGGEVKVPDSVKNDVIDLGFVSAEDKSDAYAAAQLLCQPSLFESFSIVIMESWLASRPVLVSGKCAVTKDFAVQSGGGLYFENYADFEGAVKLLLENKAFADTLGANGNKFVRNNFTWDIVAQKYISFFEQIAK